MKIYIYKITNKLNNKIYIGQTVDFKKRMKEHRYGRNIRQNMLIDRAYRKYGAENFEEEIIYEANTQSEADEIERKYINELSTLKPNGYNVLEGGREQFGAWNSKAIMAYDLKGTFLKEYKSSCELERESNGKYSSRAIRHSCCTKTHILKDILVKYKDDDIEIKEYEKQKSGRCRRVVQYNDKFEKICTYESIQIASKMSNTHRTNIVQCCTGKQKTANGYVWRYDGDDVLKNNSNPFEIKRCSVIQLNDKKEIIAEYVSCSSAARKLNLPTKAYKNIYKALVRGQKAYGYYWQKANPVPSTER